MADEHPRGNENKAEENKAEEKKLDERVNEAAKQQQEAQKKVQEETKAHNETAPQHQPILENTTQTIFERMFTSTATGMINFVKPVYTPIWMTGGALLSYSIAGLGPFVLASGLATGQYFVNKKIHKPYTFKQFRQEYAKGLISGTLFTPIAHMINGAGTILEKIGIFLGIGAPQFISSDNISDYYIKKYKKPSNLMKEIYNRDLGNVALEGIAAALKETPKTYVNWFGRTYAILPAVASMNWAASYPLELKYGLAGGTSTAYRFFTSKERNNQPSAAKPGFSSPASTADQDKIIYNFLQQNPEAARQVAQQYAAAAQQQMAKTA